MRRTLALALTVVVVVSGAAACGEDEETAAERTTAQPSVTIEATTTTTTTGAPPPTTAPAATVPVPTFDEVRVGLTEIASFDTPLALVTRTGSDTLYVAERAGRVLVMRDSVVEPEPLLDVTGETTSDGERGLLGITFSPDGAFLYVSSTNDEGDSRLDEYAMGAGDTDLDVGSRRNLLGVGQPYSNHNGGHIVFGPDGLLYYGLGDGGSAGDPEGRAQDTGELLGKILRIDPRAQGDAPYGIPADNPFVDGGGRGEIFAFGLRNPWRFSFDRANGDLWIGDVGQNAVEEIDLLPAGTGAGANLGWDRLEGSAPFEGDAPEGAIGPVFEYGREEGYSVTGGFVYRGSAIPGLVGAYVYGDYGASEVRALQVEAGRVVADRDLGVSVEEASLVSFAEDAAGELYVISLDGPLYRLDPG